jgi:hypothetical protein
MDKRQLIAALVAKTGVKIDADDPAFLLVELNLLMLENSTHKAADNLAEKTQKFGEIATRSIDDFVSVANETLSKFIQRTNEIKSTLDTLPSPVTTSLAAPLTMPNSPKTEVVNKAQIGLLLFVFIVGIFLGIVGMYFSGK